MTVIAQGAQELLTRLRAEEQARNEAAARASVARASADIRRIAEQFPELDVDCSASNTTVGEAKEMFVAAKREQVGLAGGRGIRPKTYNKIVQTMANAFGVSTAKDADDVKIVRKLSGPPRHAP
jgi:hypothetical protein